MWQKCPICNGTGQASTLVNGIYNSICPTCSGSRIISQITGLPPAFMKPAINNPTSSGSTTYHNIQIIDES